MAKRTSKQEKKAGPKKIAERKTKAKTQAKAPAPGVAGTNRVAKRKPRTVAKTSPAGLDLKKAVVRVLTSNPDQKLSPAEVRVLVMRDHIKLGEVAKLLEALQKKGKAESVGEGRRTAIPPTRVGKSAAGTRGVTRSAPGTTVDLQDAVLAVLCEEPDRPMTADEVQCRSVRYLGYTPQRSDVVFALRTNPKVTSESGGCYRGHCS